MSLEPTNANSEQGWGEWVMATDDAWTPLNFDPRMGGSQWKSWKSRIIAAAQTPALALKGVRAEALPTWSVGKKHMLSDESQRDAQAMKSLGNRVFIRKGWLRTRMAEAVESVRFPPDSLKFSIRIQHTTQAPEDMHGAIPARPFALLDNAEDAPAIQPPHFETHHLRPEQLRSLGWMLAREGRSAAGGDAVGGGAAEGRGEAAGAADDDRHFNVVWRRWKRWTTVSYPGTSPLEVGSVVKVFWAGTTLCPARVTQLAPPNVVVKYLHDDMLSDYQDWPEEEFPISKVTKIDSVIVDLRVVASYDVMGGILADKIGYGKTATTIGLIDFTLGEQEPEIPSVDFGSFIPARGTLIVVPSNLFEQWLNEIGKFVYGDKPLRKRLFKGWSPDDCPMKILAMSDVRHLTTALASDVSQADVVLCTYRLLYSPVYGQRRKEVGKPDSSLKNIMLNTWRLIDGRGDIKVGRKEDTTTKTHTNLEFPLLEMFYWKRVVFDEFHELESFESAQQNILQHLRAKYRWGLTGTPPVDSNAGVIFLSSLFRIDIPGNLPGGHIVSDLSSWEAADCRAGP